MVVPEEIKLQPRQVAVVHLQSAIDFNDWQIALRRLVKGYNMGDALMFTVPTNQVKAFKERQNVGSVKVEG